MCSVWRTGIRKFKHIGLFKSVVLSLVIKEMSVSTEDSHYAMKSNYVKYIGFMQVGRNERRHITQFSSLSKLNQIFLDRIKLQCRQKNVV